MKVALIGGGGSRAPLFVQALAGRRTRVPVQRLALFDTDPVRLRILGGLAAAIARRQDARFEVELATTLDSALEGASFVLTSIRVGGDAARARYESIARELGVIGQETVGAGGLALAMSNGPALLALAAEIEQRAPRAFTLHFTNPAGLVAQLIHDAGFRRHIGICDTPSDLIRRVALHSGRAVGSLRPTVVGLNHLSWLQHLFDEAGTDLLPSLLADPAFLGSVGEPFEHDLLRSLGLLPTEYLHYYYHRDLALARQSRSGPTRGQFLEHRNAELLTELATIDPRGRFDTSFDPAIAAYERYCADRDGTYREEVGRTDQPHSPSEAGEGYAGIALDIVAALAGGGEVSSIASVPHGGVVTGFEQDDVAETTVRVTLGGPVPQPISPLPRDALGLLHTVKAFERLASRAIARRDRTLAARALAAHPLVGSFPLGSRIVAAFLADHVDPRGSWD